MKDLIEILQEVCDLNNLFFVYGKKQVLNLLDNRNKLNSSKIYLMLDVFKRKPQLTNGGKTIANTFTGSFFLVVNSNLDMPVYSEMANDVARSKYIQNILPLLQIQEKIQKGFSCSGIEIQQFDSVDCFDVFDNNKDGIVIDFSITIRI